MSYQIKSTPYFRRMFNNSKRNGQLQRLREEYERIQEFNDRTIELKMRQVRLKRLFREIEEIKEGGQPDEQAQSHSLSDSTSPSSATRVVRRRQQRQTAVTPEQRRHHQRVEALARARELGKEISRRNAELTASGAGGFLRSELRITAKMQAVADARQEAVDRRERAAKRISYGNDQSRQNLMRQLQVRQKRSHGGSHSPATVQVNVPRPSHQTQHRHLSPDRCLYPDLTASHLEFLANEAKAKAHVEQQRLQRELEAELELELEEERLRRREEYSEEERFRRDQEYSEEERLQRQGGDEVSEAEGDDGTGEEMLRLEDLALEEELQRRQLMQQNQEEEEAKHQQLRRLICFSLSSTTNNGSELDMVTAPLAPEDSRCVSIAAHQPRQAVSNLLEEEQLLERLHQQEEQLLQKLQQEANEAPAEGEEEVDPLPLQNWRRVSLMMPFIKTLSVMEASQPVVSMSITAAADEITSSPGISTSMYSYQFNEGRAPVMEEQLQHEFMASACKFIDISER
ncbi:hypothetical protein KR009_011679 [Drosophila setifemur]|nr:hypothetical protein KR009_011679 [Drosophila setifemur]